MIDEITYGGISATPDDYLSPDGDLAAAVDLVPEDGALQPIFPPATKFTLGAGERVLWIHRMNGHTHYIIAKTVNNATTLCWVCEENGEDSNPWTRHDITGYNVTGNVTVNSIGNTLVVGDDTGVHYFLWTTVEDGGTRTPAYLYLGQKPPMLEITFGLHSDFAVHPKTKNTDNDNQSDYKGAIIDLGSIKDGIVPHLGNNDAYRSAWAHPKDVMAQSSDSNEVDFANNYSTHSIEGMDGATEDEEQSIAKFKTRLTQGVLARINHFVNSMGTKENKFVMPFFVRYAYRLHDGSYIMHSYPVLLIPNSRGPVFALDGDRGLCLNDNDDNWVGVKLRGRAYGFLSELIYRITAVPAGLTNWKDIIAGVDIGVSAPIYTYDQAGKVLGWTNMDDTGAFDEYWSQSLLTKLAGEDISEPAWETGGIANFTDAFIALNSGHDNYNPTAGFFGDFFNRYDYSKTYQNSDYPLPSYIATVPQREVSDITNDITADTAFYVIKSFDIDELAATSGAEALPLDKGTLGGLLARQRITDDWRSHDIISAAVMHNYNARMNFAGIVRTPHNPLSPAITLPMTDEATTGNPQWQVYIQLKDSEKTITVASTDAHNGTTFPRWIYYPDAKATDAIVKNGTNYYRLKLKPHDHLNGAYWLGDIMAQSTLPATTISTAPTVSTSPAVNERNKIYTSNVNNPFAVEPKGINTVGSGEIISIASATKALSQGQFGQFPLYAFCSDGVWALQVGASFRPDGVQVGDNGLYTAIQPVTRDVCLGADGITAIDDAVLFTTARGIMMLSGSATACLSDVINGKTPFDINDYANLSTWFSQVGCSTAVPLSNQVWAKDFLPGARMVYDYRNQRILAYNPAKAYAYVYSLRAHKWGMASGQIAYHLNSYPDALAIIGGNVVNISEPVTTTGNLTPAERDVILVTRPLKLQPADALKTVDTVLQRGHFDEHTQRGSQTLGAPVKSVLYGSRDLFRWHLVASSTDHRLRGFRGTPYKYFRVALIARLRPGESLRGCTVQHNPRYTNRPR